MPFPFGASVIFGSHVRDLYGYDHYLNAEGWVYTNGSLGTKDWIGSFRGKISVFEYILNTVFIGVTGFTGMRIINKNFYQGTALHVKFETNPPE